MYKVDKKYGNLNRKIYIDYNFEHLLASNFTESLFLKCSNAYKILHDLLDVYFRQIFSKILEKKCCFLIIIRRSGKSRSSVQERWGRNNRAARSAASPYLLHTDRRCFCSCYCVGIRSVHTGLVYLLLLQDIWYRGVIFFLQVWFAELRLAQEKLNTLRCTR